MSKKESVVEVNGISNASAEWYFRTYARDRIGKGEDKFQVRRDLIEAFKKELQDNIDFRILEKFGNVDKDILVGNKEAAKIIRNVTKNQQQKWIKLCKMFNCFVQTSDLLKIDDLTDERVVY